MIWAYPYSHRMMYYKKYETQVLAKGLFTTLKEFLLLNERSTLEQNNNLSC